MPSLFDDLEALVGKPLAERGYHLLIRNLYVSGHPYPLTGFAERAFVFGSAEDAHRIARDHFPDDPCTVLPLNL